MNVPLEIAAESLNIEIKEKQKKELGDLKEVEKVIENIRKFWVSAETKMKSLKKRRARMKGQEEIAGVGQGSEKG